MGRSFSRFATAGYTQVGTGPVTYGNQPAGVSLGSAYQWHFSSLPTADQNAEIARMKAAGITWVRMDVAWDGVEPTKGTYNWSYPALTAGPMVAAGINVLMILLESPAWARAVGNNPAVPDDPFATISPADYAAFCGAAAAHFGPLGVSAYEIWNEPNLDTGTTLGLGPFSPVGYASLATAAYRAVHANYTAKSGHAPAPTVVGGALAGWARLDWNSSPRTASWPAVAAGATSAAVTCSGMTSSDLYKLVTGSAVSVTPAGTAGLWPAGTYVSSVTATGCVVSPPPWLSSFPAVGASTAFAAGEDGVFGVEFGYPPDVFLTQAYAAAGGAPMFDALSLHPYAWPNLGAFRWLDSGAWAMVPEIRQIMVANGDGAKPVWFTEIGAPTGQATATWAAAAATATGLVMDGAANAGDVGALVGSAALPLHSYVASVSPGASWTVLPPTGLTVAERLTPGAAITSLSVTAAAAITVPSGTELTVWIGDGNGYGGGALNGYALPPVTVTTTAAAAIAAGATATLAIGQATVPAVLNGIVSAFPAGGLVQCASSLGQTWGTAIAAASHAVVDILTPGILATWPRGAAASTAASISSEQQQAVNVPYCFQFVASEPWPFVGPMFVFCWSDASLGANAGPYGLTRVDGTAKPALAALTAMTRSGGRSPGIGLPGYTGS